MTTKLERASLCVECGPNVRVDVLDAVKHLEAVERKAKKERAAP